MKKKLVYLVTSTLYLISMSLDCFYLAQTESFSELDENCEMISEIIEATGYFQIKRPGEPYNEPDNRNIKLCKGYLIKPSDGADIYLRCLQPDSQEPRRLPGGVLSGAQYACKPESLPCTGSSCRGGEQDPNIPLIITTGRFLNNQPEIHWLPVINTQYYTVTLSGKGVDWSKNKVNENHVTYDGPPLQQGQVYSITVQSINTEENSDFSDTTTLIMINSKDEISFQNTYDQIIAEDIDNIARDLEIANLYIEYKLRVEAIERLKQLAPDVNGSDKISIYNIISKLYQDMGFYAFSESYKLEAQEVR